MSSPSLLLRWRSVLSLPVMSQSLGGGRELYREGGRWSGLKLSSVQDPKIIIWYFLSKLGLDDFFQHFGSNCWPTCPQKALCLQPSLLPAFGAPGRWSVRDWEGARWGHWACSFPGWLNVTRTCFIQCMQLLWIVCETSVNTCYCFLKPSLLTPCFSGAIHLRLQQK